MPAALSRQPQIASIALSRNRSAVFVLLNAASDFVGRRLGGWPGLWFWILGGCPMRRNYAWWYITSLRAIRSTD